MTNPIRNAHRLAIPALPMLCAMAGCGLFGRSDAKIAKMLTNEKPSVCQEALIDIGQEQRRQFLKDVTQLLSSHESTIVRCTAARTLGKLGDPSVAPALIKGLSDKGAMVRCEAAAALGSLKAADAVESLTRAAQYDMDPYVRVEAAKALGQIGTSPAIAALIDVLRDRNTDVVYAAARALHEATSQPLDMRYDHWKSYWDKTKGQTKGADESS